MVLNLRLIRESKDISQAELARRVKVNQTAVSQWEREITLPSCEKIPEIANALGVPIGELFCTKPTTEIRC